MGEDCIDELRLLFIYFYSVQHADSFPDQLEYAGFIYRVLNED